MITIADAWNVYRTNMISGNASDAEVLEARRAFYWGARFVLDSMKGAAAVGVDKVDAWISADIDRECGDD